MITGLSSVQRSGVAVAVVVVVLVLVLFTFVAIRTSTTCKLIIDTIQDNYVYNVNR